MKRGSGFARWMKSHPATPMHGGKPAHKPASPLKYTCPLPQRYAQDQYRCAGCGLIWSVDEERPTCQSTSHT